MPPKKKKSKSPTSREEQGSTNKNNNNKHNTNKNKILIEKLPQENHRREQYWYNSDTRQFVLNLIAQHEHPCCLFLPSLLLEQGLPVQSRILDIDDRFDAGTNVDSSSCFHLFDAWRPIRPNNDPPYDLIVMDPPFDTVKCDQLYRAVRVLIQQKKNAATSEQGKGEEGDEGKEEEEESVIIPRLLISYPTRRADALLATFVEWGLRPAPVGWNTPRYASVTDDALVRDGGIHWYLNWDPEMTAT